MLFLILRDRLEGTGSSRNAKVSTVWVVFAALPLPSLVRTKVTLPIYLEELGDDEDWTQGSKVSSTKWACPICLAEVRMGLKRHHIATRHAGVPVNLFEAGKPMAVAFSKELPDDQTDFQCPLGKCRMRLPRLPAQARKHAKRQHLLDFHPRYKGNLQQYFALTLK